MNTSSRTDWALLQRYVGERSQEAFAALVTRHLDMVYTTCLREVGNVSLAEDSAQAVFISLAMKAHRLSSRTHIAGSLFQAARFAARSALRRETRRSRYKCEAARAGDASLASADNSWREIEPLLTDAVARLSSSDREAILLRYFDGLRIAEVAASLGIGEQAARKRITRAVERLRRHLQRQGIADLGTVSLIGLLPLHAAKAAPPALAPTIARYGAGGAGAKAVNLGLLHSSVSQLSQGILNAMKIAQLKVTAVVTTAALVAIGAAAIGATHGVIQHNSPHGTNTPVMQPKLEYQQAVTAELRYSKLIVLCITQYALDHNQAMPSFTSLPTLRTQIMPYVTGYRDPTVLPAPVRSDPGKLFIASTTQQPFLYNAQVTKLPQSQSQASSTVVIYSAKPDALGFRTVGYANGLTRSVSEQQWQAIKAAAHIS